ncbi:MAG: peptide deformylase, partial [Candidatus Methylumidiphilus sp.]
PAGGGLTLAELHRLEWREQAQDFSVLTVDAPSQARALRQPSRPIDPASPGIDRLITHLERTARQHGGLGIAAVQIGIPVRLALLRRAGAEHFQAFANPAITAYSENHLASWENCLSVPWGYRYTERAAQITVSHQSKTGATLIETLKGEEAVVFQQEIDHLDGHLLDEEYGKEWFIPAAEMDTFARDIWRQCQKLEPAQCDELMRTRWEAHRAGQASTPQ